MTFATEDIVERLRAHDEYNDFASPAFCGKVADEIERLRAEGDLKGYRLDDALAEIERLRGLLEAYGRHDPDCKFGTCWCDESKKVIHD